MLKTIVHSAAPERSRSIGISRTMFVDFVISEHGLAKSRNACSAARVSPYFSSACWYGSHAVPIVTGSRFQAGRANSRRSTGPRFVFTTIRCSKSRPVS